MSDIKWPIYTKVMGVTHKNDDGTSRQELLGLCSEGDELYLYRDEYNEYDPNAIQVDSPDGQVGFLSRTIAKKLAPLMDDGDDLYCEITNITGGEYDKPTLGCNIKITPADPLADIMVTIPRTEPEVKPEPKARGLIKRFFMFLWKVIMILGLISLGLIVLAVWLTLKSG